MFDLGPNVIDDLYEVIKVGGVDHLYIVSHTLHLLILQLEIYTCNFSVRNSSKFCTELKVFYNENICHRWN